MVDRVRMICKPGTYCVLGKDSIPSVIPEKLKQKCHGAVVIASNCERGTVICINLQRLDQKDKAIDQMPFALIAVPNKAASSCLLHHADYDGRTTYLDKEFLNIIDESGIEPYIQIPESPPKRNGSISELKGSSHEKGFLKAKAKIIEHDENLD